MHRLLFSALIFSLFGSPFAAAAEVEAHEVEGIVVTGSKRSKEQGNAYQKITDKMNASGFGDGRLAEDFSYIPSDFASVLFKAAPTGRSSGKLIYAYQGDKPDTTLPGESKAGPIALKLLGGTVMGIGAFAFVFSTSFELCDHGQDCGEVPVSLLSVPVGISAGVSVWDQHDRFIYTLAGSLVGFGIGIALDIASDGGAYSLWLPVITATAASEWSRYRPESRQYSLGLRSEPRGGLSVVAALRF